MFEEEFFNSDGVRVKKKSLELKKTNVGNHDFTQNNILENCVLTPQEVNVFPSTTI